MILKGKEVYQLILSGAKNVVANENNLNKINVFPVPDGDTGTNLALTMNQVISESTEHESIVDQLNNFATIAINNAYGNSGMIFAEYMNGMSDYLKTHAQGHPNDFLHCFGHAYEQAYQSVVHPKEGTILSVMKEWTLLIEKSVHNEIEFVFSQNLEHLKEAVQNTKYQMKILKDNNVVDAGAMAFFYFIEGMAQYLIHGKSDNITFKASHLDLITEPLSSIEIGQYRYCCQFQISTDLKMDNFKKQLDIYGDSLVVNQKENTTSVHIHCNNPEVVMKDILKVGHITQHKIDDMLLQANMIHNPKSKIAILTDSIADLPKAFIDENQIHVLPLNIIVDTVVYKDKVTMTPQMFYQYLDDFELSPTSSQPNLPTIERYLNQILSHYDEIIGIFVSSKMSGTYHNVLKVLSKLSPTNKKIQIIDSRRNSAAQGLIVFEAVNARNDGKNFDELVKYIEELIRNSSIFVSVKDLKYMIKGGRVSKLTGSILSTIKLKPVISINEKGEGTIPYKTFSQKNATRSIIKKIKNDLKHKDIQAYSLVYADHEDDLLNLKNEAIKLIGKQPDYIESISPIVGLNAGNGSFAIAYITKDKS